MYAVLRAEFTSYFQRPVFSRGQLQKITKTVILNIKERFFISVGNHCRTNEFCERGNDTSNLSV